jgi:hypothetical protein
MMGRMPSSYGRGAAIAAFALPLMLSVCAHAADTSAFGVNDPFAAAIQLWSAALSSIDSLAHQLASVLELYQPPAPEDSQQSFALNNPPSNTPDEPARAQEGSAQMPQSTSPSSSTSSPTYVDQKYNFKIGVPYSSTKISASQYNDLYVTYLPDGVFIIGYSLSNTSSRGEFDVEISTSTSDVANCLDVSPDIGFVAEEIRTDDLGGLGTTSINGTQFFHFGASMSGVGQYANESWLKALKNGRCYALISTIFYGRLDTKPPWPPPGSAVWGRPAAGALALIRRS